MRRFIFFCLVLLAISSMYVSGCANKDTSTQTIIEEDTTTTVDDRASVAGLMKVAVSPSPGAQGVPIDTSITVTWNRVMKYATINTGSFTLMGPGGAIAGTISFTGLSARFTPYLPLDISTTYTATLSTLIQDAKLKHLPLEYSWSFTTAPDITPPAIVTTSPAEDATGVPIYTTVSVEFSEPIEPTTIISPATTLSVVKTSDATPVAGTVSMVGNNVARFTLSALLQVDTQYTATITTDVTDLHGNHLAAPLTWNFTTGASALLGRYLYVNNEASPNSITGFAINQTNGSLTYLAGSPYATGGVGQSSYYAANTIALAPNKAVLFVANKSSSTITVFSIDPATGVLTSIGAPVAGGASMDASGSLAVNPTETLLFVGNNTGSISVFSIAVNGALTPIAGSPFATGTAVDGISLSPDGTKLYVSPSGSQLVVMAIAAGGALSQIAGSPFSYSAGGTLTSFVLGSLTVGLGGATGGILSSYTMAGTGGPTALVSSLWMGLNQQCVSTGRDGQLAILSGGSASTIGVVQVAANGTLTQVTGSPFTTTYSVTGYAAVHPSGDYLYATEGTYIEAFNISPTGALTSIGVNAVDAVSRVEGLVIY